MAAQSIVHALDEIVHQLAEQRALCWLESTWTFEELHRSIEAVAAGMVQQGIRPGDRAALLLRNTPQYVALYYGALSCGAVVVPLNPMEKAAALRVQVEHSGARLVIGDQSHPEWSGLVRALPAGTTPVPLEIVRTGSALDHLRSVIGSSHGGRHAGLSSDQPAAIIYTSGTTGRPKGVLLSHGNLLSNARAIVRYLALTRDDIGLCTLPFHFSYGNSVLHTHLLAGARLHLEDSSAFPPAILQNIQQNGVTCFPGVPSTFALLLGRSRLSDYDLSSLRCILQAGGAMPRPIAERIRQAVPRAKLFVMYGQTEATARIAYLPPERLDEKAGSVGIPVDGVEIEVRGPEGGPMPPGGVGEVHVRGPNVMLGYWQDPEATARVLRNGWLATGDLGYKDEDGYLYLRGRAVEMIKVGAYRVSPLEVEEAIAAMPEVEEVAAVGIEDELLGQAVKAIIVPKSGCSLDARAVKAQCHRLLASYKIPKIVELVAELPKTSSGKVKKHLLKEGSTP